MCSGCYCIFTEFGIDNNNVPRNANCTYYIGWQPSKEELVWSSLDHLEPHPQSFALFNYLHMMNAVLNTENLRQLYSKCIDWIEEICSGLGEIKSLEFQPKLVGRNEGFIFIVNIVLFSTKEEVSKWYYAKVQDVEVDMVLSHNLLKEVSSGPEYCFFALLQNSAGRVKMGVVTQEVSGFCSVDELDIFQRCTVHGDNYAFLADTFLMTLLVHLGQFTRIPDNTENWGFVGFDEEKQGEHMHRLRIIDFSSREYRKYSFSSKDRFLQDWGYNYTQAMHTRSTSYRSASSRLDLSTLEAALEHQHCNFPWLRSKDAFFDVLQRSCDQTAQWLASLSAPSVPEVPTAAPELATPIQALKPTHAPAAPAPADALAPAPLPSTLEAQMINISTATTVLSRSQVNYSAENTMPAGRYFDNCAAVVSFAPLKIDTSLLSDRPPPNSPIRGATGAADTMHLPQSSNSAMPDVTAPTDVCPGAAAGATGSTLQPAPGLPTARPMHTLTSIVLSAPTEGAIKGQYTAGSALIVHTRKLTQAAAVYGETLPGPPNSPIPKQVRRVTSAAAVVVSKATAAAETKAEKEMVTPTLSGANTLSGDQSLVSSLSHALVHQRAALTADSGGEDDVILKGQYTESCAELVNRPHIHLPAEDFFPQYNSRASSSPCTLPLVAAAVDAPKARLIAYAQSEENALPVQRYVQLHKKYEERVDYLQQEYTLFCAWFPFA